MNLLSAFFLGLASGLHCIGMCSPLMIAFSKNNQNAKFLFNQVAYQFGRISIYALLGMLLPGTIFLLNLQTFSHWLAYIIGTTFIAIGLFSLFGHLKPISTQSSFIVGLFSKLPLQKLRAGYFKQFIFGLLNGLIPCGMVFIALGGAALQANVINGGLFMAFFGLGTVPALLAIIWGNNKLKFLQQYWANIQIVVIILAGISLIIRGAQIQSKIAENEKTEQTICH